MNIALLCPVFPFSLPLIPISSNTSSCREYGKLLVQNVYHHSVLPSLSDPHNERFSTKLYDCLPVSPKAHITAKCGSS